MTSPKLSVIGHIAWGLGHCAGGGCLAAMTATKLGATVTFVSSVGDDLAGAAAKVELASFGLDTEMVDVSQTKPTRPLTEKMSVSGNWAAPRLGDHLGIESLFSQDLLVIDVQDLSLYRFLVDLPVHTYPAARLIGSLAPLAVKPEAGWEIVARLDYASGSAADLLRLTGAENLRLAVVQMQRMMQGSNLRSMLVQTDDGSAFGFTSSHQWHHPGFGETHDQAGGNKGIWTGAAAWCLAQRMSISDVLRYANAFTFIASRDSIHGRNLPDATALHSFLEDVSASPPQRDQ